jgi:hypothetical protein
MMLKLLDSSNLLPINIMWTRNSILPSFSRFVVKDEGEAAGYLTLAASELTQSNFL